MTARLQLRKATQDDIPALLEITRAIVAEFKIERLIDYYFSVFGAIAFAEEFYHAQAHSTVLALNDTIVGYYLFAPKPEDRQLGELSKLYVAPEYRGNRYGELLMNLAIEKAKRLGFNSIFITTAREFAVDTFYQRFGAEEVPDLRYPDNPNSMAMEIDLSKESFTHNIKVRS